MKAVTVLYVLLLAGAFVGCGANLRAMWMRHHEPRHDDAPVLGRHEDLP